MSLFSKLFRTSALEKAERAHASGDHAKSVRFFTALIDDPQNSSPPSRQLWTFYLHRGLSLRALGRQQEALRDYQKASELNPQSHKPYLNAGIILGEDFGRHSEALAKFEEANRLRPNDVESLMCVGLTKAKLGHEDDAERIFSRALEMEPENWLVLYNLGNICLHENRLPEAVDLFSRANWVNPHDPDIRHNLSIAQTRLAASGR
jgi:Flp pilus assembly protein TadD